MKKEFFNLRASDKVSLWRSIPDSRDTAYVIEYIWLLLSCDRSESRCLSVQYPQDLPSASVVIVFKNERWSPVLRTVYSVLNRSPKHMLKEVILVDDQSDIGKVEWCLSAIVNTHDRDLSRGNGTTSGRVLRRTLRRFSSGFTSADETRFDQSEKFRREKRSVAQISLAKETHWTLWFR